MRREYTTEYNVAILYFLASEGILATDSRGRILVSRDSMCSRYRGPPNSYPEAKGGAYDSALNALRAAFPNLLLNWGMKDDNNLYLDVMSPR
jgi:hypothetical protein